MLPICFDKFKNTGCFLYIMIETILTELGFSGKEIKVYLEIVKSEKITASKISKNIKLPRSSVYDLIEKLLDKGLISYTIQQKKKTFQVTDFNKFISKLKEQEKLAHLAILELNKLNVDSKESYKVEVLEGKEGLKAHFDYIQLLLKTKKLKDFLVFGTKLESINKIKFFFLSRFKEYIRLSSGIDFRVIWDFDVYNDKFMKTIKGIGKHKFFPKKLKNKATTAVFNDFIVIIFNVNKPIIIRIKSKAVSGSYRDQFNLFWELLD